MRGGVASTGCSCRAQRQRHPPAAAPARMGRGSSGHLRESHRPADLDPACVGGCPLRVARSPLSRVCAPGRRGPRETQGRADPCRDRPPSQARSSCRRDRPSICSPAGPRAVEPGPAPLPVRGGGARCGSLRTRRARSDRSDRRGGAVAQDHSASDARCSRAARTDDPTSVDAGRSPRRRRRSRLGPRARVPDSHRTPTWAATCSAASPRKCDARRRLSRRRVRRPGPRARRAALPRHRSSTRPGPGPRPRRSSRGPGLGSDRLWPGIRSTVHDGRARSAPPDPTRLDRRTGSMRA